LKVIIIIIKPKNTLDNRSKTIYNKGDRNKRKSAQKRTSKTNRRDAGTAGKREASLAQTRFVSVAGHFVLQGGVEMEKYLTCEQVAERYGVKVITIWAWIREKKLPAIRIGKGYRIRPEDLEAFEAARKTK